MYAVDLGLGEVTGFQQEATEEPPPITQHPMWGLQVRLEGHMRSLGLDKSECALADAKERRQMTRLAPVRSLASEWVEPVAQTFMDWRRAAARSRGVKPMALEYLLDADPRLCAFLGLHEVLDSLTAERTAAPGVCTAIGRTIEHEQRLRAMARANPALIRSIQRDFIKNRSTAEHRERANINRMNHLVETRQVVLEWQSWSEEAHFRVGLAILDAIIRATGWFSLGDDPCHVYRAGKPSKPKLVLVPRDGLHTWIAKAMRHDGLMRPEFTPTVVPPRRWEGTRIGGYWTPQVRTPRLIRFKASQVDQRDAAADEYEALDMPMVFDSLHYVQEVPWGVNAQVLAIAEKLWTRDLGVAGLPLQGEIEMPDGREDMEGDELKAHKKKRAAVHRRRAKQFSKVAAASRTLKVAREYLDYDTPFYYPHMLDFRGRMYPIPIGLQPQGDDLARGLLQFHKGVAITADNQGDLWLAIHLASVWGNDKWNFDRRIKWVYENEAMFRDIARWPLRDMRWALADKPFQALAACLDWVRWLEHGDGYVSHLPVSVDGTCNGIQHLSAMTRDREAGRYVNLVPLESPQDIYKHIAGELQATIERIGLGGGEEGAKANYWLELCTWEIPRGLTKRPVMVLPYGGTLDSYLTYIREWLDEHDPLPDDASQERWKERGKRVGFLAKHMWETVKTRLAGAVKVMEWLKLCASKAIQGNQPIFWVTPTGFVVRHFYGKEESRKLESMLNGKRVQLWLNSTTKDLDAQKQLRGIAPNFVHSLDADALRRCILLCKERGIEGFTAIHDAYGTHAGTMGALSAALREAFVETHRVDVLANFRNACASVVIGLYVSRGMDPLEAAQKADEELPPMLEKGDLDIEEVMDSDYFFA